VVPVGAIRSPPGPSIRIVQAVTRRAVPRRRSCAAEHSSASRGPRRYRRSPPAAPRAATGRSAKQLADDRVALQAKRLLAHSDLPVAAVSRALGFSEPTNFGKFFTRATGRTPGEFRRTQR